MTDELLTVLGDDAAATDERAPQIGDRELRRLYEALVLTRTLDEQCESLHTSGKLPFWVPSGAVAAVAAGVAAALRDGDWLYPSFRDSAAFLLRGGSLEQLVAQLLASADDALLGRQLAHHTSLPDGRYVSVSGVVGNQAQHAAGTALAMALGRVEQVVAMIYGRGTAAYPGYYAALEVAARFEVPLLLTCRTNGAGNVIERAAGFGIDGDRIDGGDVLAVYKAAHEARGTIVAGGGSRLIEAVLREEEAEDPATRLRPYLEHRGIWDPGQEEELVQRCEGRVTASVEVAQSLGPPPRATMLDDVASRRSWMLQEQLEELSAQDEAGDEPAAGG